ncbi:MAG: cupin domain-containing protein [Candidatus Poribacteria bacterium]|nr:cupin domain-containing protein [Candidatus Poribacteria bacterium]
MRIAHVHQHELRESTGVHGGAGHILIKSLWDGDAFQTPWRFVHYAVLPPGGGIGYHRHDNCEEMFTILDNAAQFTHNGRTAEIAGGATVPCRKGESHAIYNHTDRETRFMNFCVVDPGGEYDCTDFGDDRVGAPLESVDRLPVGRLDRNLLTFTPNVHKGKGEVGVRQVWAHPDFRTHWGFVAHCLVPPGASVGYHRHGIIEETYIIMEGSGRMTVDDETEEVHVGDAIPNRLGGSHGIYNHTEDDLEMLVMAVCMTRGQFDSIDAGDDLSTR